MVVPETIAIPLAVAVPEAGVVGFDAVAGDDAGDAAGQVGKADVVLIGPGVHSSEEARALLAALVPAAEPDTPVVLDAFALGVLPEVTEVAKSLAGRLVLTPNRSEARRLLGGDLSDDTPAVDGAVRIARRWDCVVSLEGVVAAADGPPGSIETGHSGLGTSGSGDVLAGAITGLLARGCSPADAAAWGTYLHAASGDRLAARVGRVGFLARELLDELPLVLSELEA
jgi:ADP-dependent NAD(P)H-hydrate dehydratase